MQAFLDRHVLRRDLQHADLRGHNHHIILGDVITRGAQAVAIQHRADHLAIGKRDRGRAVPGFQQAGMVFIKGPPVRGHGLMPGPGLGHHHQHHMRQRPPGHVQKFHDVIEHGRIAAALDHYREQFFEIITE